MKKNVKIILIIVLCIICILNGIYNIKLNNENIDLKEKNNKLTNKDKIETYEDDIKEIVKKELWFNSFIINDIEPPSKRRLAI